MKRISAALLIAYVLLLPAHAEVTYSYAGNVFTAILPDPTGAYRFSDSVTATLTLDVAIPQLPNTTIDASMLLGFALTMTDGSQILSTLDSTGTATFTFDGDGELSSWFVSVGGWHGIVSKADRVYTIDQGTDVIGGRVTVAQSRTPARWQGFQVRN